MPPKRNSEGAPSGTPAKVPKTELKPEDFSNSVKRRLQSSTRTGQACDRCKVRKIRCDGLPGGCSPCLQNNTECRTTDRITGRAAPRGYVDNLENQSRQMSDRIRELENLLIQNGIEVKPSAVFPDPSVASFGFNAQGQNGSQMWNGAGQTNPYQISPPSLDSSTQQETNLFKALPAFRTACPGDNYLGVSPGNSHLSSIKGTALSILGMEIDIADFQLQDMDEPDQSVFHPQLYNKSYQAFLQSALNVNPKLDKVKFPERAEGLTYAQWYFRVLNPYCPVLHKPTFMTLLTRTYDDPNFQPTVAQSVMVHMVFAIMFYQYATRNFEDAGQQAYLNSQSNLHYHYSLSQFYQLICSHTFEDVQALTLICGHLRSFPKPGASWMLSSITLALAVELGLHRSAKRWASEHMPNALEIEMRKRVFYTLYAIHVTLSGKLGRPLALHIQDFDIEIPEAIDDEVISEAGIDTSRSVKCLHQIGIVAYKLLPLYTELYTTIYAVRRIPETYIETVNRLEAKIRAWTNDLPPELSRGAMGNNSQEARVFALYAEAWALELRLLLRHPSVSMTNDPSFNAENMRICVDCSRQMLSVVKQIQAFKSIDTTWYNSAVYVMAITVTLFAQWEKRNETTAAELAALRIEMDEWLDIMGDVGALLGSGSRLREAVRVVTDGTLGLLSRSLQSKNANGFINQSGGNQDVNVKSEPRPVPDNVHANGFNSHGFGSSFPDANQANNGNGSSSTYISPDNQLTHQSTPYPLATQYSSYPDPPSNAYPGQESNAFSAYPSANADSVEAPLLAAFAAQASQVAPNTWPRSQGQSGGDSGSQSWQQWTSAMAGNLEPQDRYSATALMQLGGRDLNVADGVTASAPLADMTGPQSSVLNSDAGSMSATSLGSGVPTGAWPLNIFDIGQGPSTS